MAYIAPDHDDHPPAWAQDATHVSYRGGTVREVLESELADHAVEAAAGKGQVLRIGRPPVHFIARARRGHGDHRRVVIQSGDGSGRANAFGGTVGDDSGAASHVQDGLPVLDLSRVEDGGHPGAEDRWHEVVGVDLRRASGKLPTLHITHSPPLEEFTVEVSWRLDGSGCLAGIMSRHQRAARSSSPTASGPTEVVVFSSRRGCNPAGPRGGVQGTSSRLAPRPSVWLPSGRREENTTVRTRPGCLLDPGPWAAGAGAGRGGCRVPKVPVRN